jgi:CO/xanthine dehydrogenase Mo-binding subunit
MSVGEPLVIVIAENRYPAEDALDDIDIELEQLPAVPHKATFLTWLSNVIDRAPR